jgi:hypothetical protein
MVVRNSYGGTCDNADYIFDDRIRYGLPSGDECGVGGGVIFTGLPEHGLGFGPGGIQHSLGFGNGALPGSHDHNGGGLVGLGSNRGRLGFRLVDNFLGSTFGAQYTFYDFSHDRIASLVTPARSRAYGRQVYTYP